MVECDSCRIEKKEEEFEDSGGFCKECLEHLLFSAPSFEMIPVRMPTMKDIEGISKWI